MIKLSNAAVTSKAIKKELGELFPDTKFSVKSQTFEDGDAVNVTWTDGPTKPMVESIIKKYQSGKWNNDEQEYEVTNKRNDIPQVNYVNIPCRRLSHKVEEEILSKLRVNYKECADLNRDGWVESLDKSMLQMIWEVFNVTSY
jgi:acetylornithine deacetylase/succinyl-diaminopimelate desuccinylase-like protein